jgi:hypothetical protein
MRHFFLDTLGDLKQGYCVLGGPPRGLGMAYQRLSRGELIGARYPADATMEMSPDHPGIRVPDVVPNTNNYLIVSAAVAEEIRSATTDLPVEYLPLCIRNHKHRVVGGEHCIVNPLGPRDCLNTSASDIVRLNAPGDAYDGRVVRVRRFVLDPGKVAEAPAIFRVLEAPHRYVVTERLAAALVARSLTNIVLTEIPHAGATGST